jgi:hypothetical protein
MQIRKEILKVFILLLDDDGGDFQKKGDIVKGFLENYLWSEHWRIATISAYCNLKIEIY